MNIKRIVLSLTFLFFITLTVVAQKNERGRIKALKTAHITNALDLTSSEAEKFWPIYNSYQDAVHTIKIASQNKTRRKIRAIGGVDQLTDKEASVIVQQFLAIDTKLAQLKTTLHKDLKGIISSKKMIKLMIAERSFNKELLKRLRNRKLNRN